MIQPIRDLWRALRALASIARVLSTDGSGPLQVMRVEGFLGEIREGVPRYGEWGLASNPPDDAEAVVLALGGDRGRMVVIGVEDRETRLDVAKGAAYLHGQVADRYVGVTESGAVQANGETVAVTSQSGTVVVQSAGGQLQLLNLDGNGAILVGVGDVTVQSTTNVNITAPTVTINGVNFSAHTHDDPVSGVTGPPN